MAKLQYTICSGRGVHCVVEFDSDYPVDSPRILETFPADKVDDAQALFMRLVDESELLDSFPQVKHRGVSD